MVDSSLVGLYGRYLFGQFMYKMNSTLRYQNERPESGELSEEEDHYSTEMRTKLTCKNGSDGLFWEIYQLCLRLSSKDI